MKVGIQLYLIALGVLPSQLLAVDLYIAAGDGGGGGSAQGVETLQGKNNGYSMKGGKGGVGPAQPAYYQGRGGAAGSAYVSTVLQGGTAGRNGSNNSPTNTAPSTPTSSYTYTPLPELGSVNAESGEGSVSARGGNGGNVSISGGNLTSYNNIFIASGSMGVSGAGSGTSIGSDGYGGTGGTVNVSFDSMRNVDSLTLVRSDGALNFTLGNLIIGGRTTRLNIPSPGPSVSASMANIDTITLEGNGRLEFARPHESTNSNGTKRYKHYEINGNNTSINYFNANNAESLSFDLSKAAVGGTMLTVDNGFYTSDGAIITLKNSTGLIMNEGSSVTLLKNNSSSISSSAKPQMVAGYRDHVVYKAALEGTNYILRGVTAWNNGGDSLGTGDFTVTAADGVVTISDNLGTVKGSNSWDGDSFHKKGDGHLVLTGTINYTGESRVDAYGSVTYTGNVTTGSQYVNRGMVSFQNNANLTAGLMESSGGINVSNGAEVTFGTLILSPRDIADSSPYLTVGGAGGQGGRVLISEMLVLNVSGSDFNERTMTFDLSHYFSLSGTSSISMLDGSIVELGANNSFYEVLAGITPNSNATVTIRFGKGVNWDKSDLSNTLSPNGWIMQEDNWGTDRTLVLKQVAAIPEPATTTLTLLGIACLLLHRKRNNVRKR